MSEPLDLEAWQKAFNEARRQRNAWVETHVALSSRRKYYDADVDVEGALQHAREQLEAYGSEMIRLLKLKAAADREVSRA